MAISLLCFCCKHYDATIKHKEPKILLIFQIYISRNPWICIHGQFSKIRSQFCFYFREWKDWHLYTSGLYSCTCKILSGSQKFYKDGDKFGQWHTIPQSFPLSQFCAIWYVYTYILYIMKCYIALYRRFEILVYRKQNLSNEFTCVNKVTRFYKCWNS